MRTIVDDNEYGMIPAGNPTATLIYEKHMSTSAHIVSSIEELEELSISDTIALHENYSHKIDEACKYFRDLTKNSVPLTYKLTGEWLIHDEGFDDEGYMFPRTTLGVDHARISLFLEVCVYKTTTHNGNYLKLKTPKLHCILDNGSELREFFKRFLDLHEAFFL